MTKLRQKMIRAMELKNFSNHTQRAYLAAVTGLAKHYQQSPDKLTKEMIEDYLLYLKNEKGNAPNSCAGVLTGLRFFYNHVTQQQIPIEYSLSRKVRKLPTVLLQDDICNIINAAENLKHRLMLMTTYSAGLRAGELIALKPKNIENKKMLIKVEKGKGRKERYTLLSKRLLPELRHYYKTFRPKIYLFPSSYKHKKHQALSYESVRCIYENARKKAGVKNGAGIHTLRHYAEFRIMPSQPI
jgi:site-specific recombinase XerD